MRWGSFFFFSSRRRHTRLTCDWSSDVCSSDLAFMRADGQEVRLNVLRDGARRQIPVRWEPREVRFRTGRIRDEIGRASCRERVQIWVGAASLKRKGEQCIAGE